MNVIKIYKIVTLVSILIYSNLNAQNLKSIKRIDNDSIHIDFINPYYAPVQIKLTPSYLGKNKVRIISNEIIKAKDTLKNAVILPRSIITDTSKTNFIKYVKLKGSFGDPRNKINKQYNYELPYKVGKSYKLIQGIGGRFSHQDINSKYALDFGLKIGDTIVEARGGLVFHIKEDSKEYCASKKCNDKANNILILHDDGSYAHYVHLNYNGVLVAVGDKVEAGQSIGISGMTGFTNTPHLHFAVLRAGNISIPFQFKGQKTKILRRGWRYRKAQ